MNSNDIIVRPIISEKSTELMEMNKYVFKVPMSVNKTMIKKAIKDIFGVQPVDVNIVLMRGKRRRVRYQFGITAAWKKAIVTLKDGDKIDVFEA
jgi:large subunit ribosomal protein L23